METEYATNNDPLYASDQIIGTAGGTLGSEEEEDSLNNLVKPSPLASADLLVDENNFYCDTNLNGSGVNIVPDTQQSLTGKRPAVDNDEEGDLGPETDVDAGDEIMLSPEEELSAAAKEEKQFEPKEMDASEETPEDYNPFITHSNEEQFEVRQETVAFQDELSTAPISDTPMQHNPFDIPMHDTQDPFQVAGSDVEIPQEFSQVEASSAVESTESDYLNQNVDVTDDCETIRNVPELVEQLPEVVNDEMSLFGKSLDTLQAFIAPIPQDEKPDDTPEMDIDVMEAQREIQQEAVAEGQQSVSDQPPQEHLEDVSCEITTEQKSDCVVAELTRDTPATESGAIVESEEESDEEWNYIKGEQQKELKVKESHAISQAIAESQEACSDLINEDALSEREPELVDLEKQDSEDTMASKLNPDAQEFVPSSPVNSVGSKENNHLNMLSKDEILAQSPRKGTGSGDNALFDLPDADQFNAEISKCPHEFDGVYLPQSPTNYQEINLKEAMHGDEKKDESVEDTSEKSPQPQTVDDQLNDIIKNIPAALSLGDTVPGEHDPMNMSYHQDINDGSFSTDPHDMNSVHMLPSKEELEDTAEEDKENGDAGEEDLKPEEDMFHNEMESEKPESELEAASVLLDFAQQKPDLVDFVVDTVPQGHLNVTDLDSDFTGMDQAKLSPNADVFVPSKELQGIDLNSLPESETVKVEKETVEDSPESDHCFLKESGTDLLVSVDNVVESKVDTPPPTPAATNNGLIEISDRLTSPEPQKLMEAMEKLAEPVAEETKPVVEVVEETSKTEKEEDSVLLPTAIGAAAGVSIAAVAAAAATAPAKEAEVKKKTTKAVESSKKDEPKAKPRTTKPASAGVKPTPAAAAPRTTLAAKTTGKVSPVKPPSTLSTRPKSSPATATKSPLTAKSPLTTARKPLTSPSTATKSPLATSAAPKTTVASRTSTTKSPLTKPNSATTTRTSSGVAPSRTSSTATSGNVKKTTSTVTTTKNLSTKPTVLSARPKVPSTGATSGVSSTTTTLTKTTRTTLSTAKPRVPSATTTTSTRTAAAAKDNKEVASKPAAKTTSRPLSASTKPLVPKPTITSTLRKAAETTSKVSTNMKNGVKTTTTTTSTVGAKRPGNLTSRTTTTTTKKTATTKVGASPTEKKPVVAVTEIKAIEVTEKLSNGDLLHMDEKIDGVDVKKDVESQIILDNAAQLIIDVKND